MDRILTAIAWKVTTVRLSKRDNEYFIAAASLEGVSRSEFLRKAIRDRSKRILPRKFRSTLEQIV